MKKQDKTQDVKQRLFLVRGTTSGEYEIVQGIHPFHSETIYHSIVFYAERPVNHAGYYVIVQNNIPHYVFEARESDAAKAMSLSSSREKLGKLMKERGLAAIDTTAHAQTPAKFKESAGNDNQYLFSSSVRGAVARLAQTPTKCTERRPLTRTQESLDEEAKWAEAREAEQEPFPLQ